MLLLDAVCVCKVWVGGVIDWVSTHQGSFSVEAARNVCFWTLVCISFKKKFFSSATHFSQYVQHFHESTLGYGCQCLGFLTCAQMLMHAIAHGSCMDTVRDSALKVDWNKIFFTLPH